MPSFKFIVRTPIYHSFLTSKVRGIYDLPDSDEIKHSWEIDLPIDKFDWNIGIIVGASGTGKTLLGKKIFDGKYYHNGYKWNNKKSFIDNFDCQDSNKIFANLNAVGFSSPPSWLKPYSILSNGEKFRAELARLITEKKEMIIFDEFTSVVDRNVAKIGSAALQKAIRKSGMKFIALSCHYDIIEWLEPDWIYEPATNNFKRRKLRRPKIKLQLFRVHYKAWELFKMYHYLTSNLNKSAQCFICEWEGIPVGFTSALPMRMRNGEICFRGHRTVVLPDYQGIGIGNAMVEMMAKHYLEQGYRYRGKTSHPALVKYRLQNPEKWKPVKSGNAVSKFRKTTSIGRLTMNFEYIGKSVN